MAPIRCSRRLPWERAENALSRRLDNLRARNAPLLDLTLTNPTRAGIPYPVERIAASLADPRSAAYDPSPRGLASARDAIAGRYAERGLAVDADDLLLTASTSEAYSLLFKLLCDPGDCVLTPHPSYPLLDLLAALEGVRLVPYPLAFDGRFHLDPAALEGSLAAAGDTARAILIVSPNNPTGAFLKRGERDALVALAAAHGLPLVCDEVFADYPFHGDPERSASLVEETGAACFTLDGISKSLGLPQLKLGWIHVGGPRGERAGLYRRLELVADTYLSVGAPVQLALPSLLALRAAISGAILARCRANLAVLEPALAGSAASLLPVEGGWVACIRLPATRSDEEWALDLLEREHVVVQPGYFYDFPARLCVLVVSLLSDEATFAEGIARLVARVAAS